MPMTPKAAKAYKARRPEMTLDDVVTPEIRERRKATVAEAKDEAAQEAAGKAYDKAMPSPERFAKGGKVGSASKRADGIAKRGHTRGTMI
jgi:hypothetical protein